MSAKSEIFTIYDTSGDPLPGLTVTFYCYSSDIGTVLTPPSIIGLGGGIYKFTPVFPNNQTGIVYIIDCTLSSLNRFYSRHMRPEDWLIEDDVGFLKKYVSNKWETFTSGVNNNKVVIYENDGTTVLKKYNLLDASGLPTVSNPYKRVPE